jgi:magnesium-transporting ATPase (P-type)
VVTYSYCSYAPSVYLFVTHLFISCSILAFIDSCFQVGLPGYDSMPSSLNMLSKHERASYCNHYWEKQFKKISVLDFSRDRKMMSILCSRKQQQIMFSKGAPESIIARCTNILCNGDGSTIPLTADIRAELESRFHRFDSFCAPPFHHLSFP